MDWQDLFHWLYIAGMAIGAIHFISLSKNPRGVPKYEYLIATFIPIWSGLAYLSMVLPQGNLQQGKLLVANQIAHYARYLDWIVTTPLLLLALSLLDLLLDERRIGIRVQLEEFLWLLLAITPPMNSLSRAYF